MVVEISRIMMRSGDIPPAVIVGVGYTDPLEARRLRVRDFTTPAPASAIPSHFVAWKAEPGGAGRFQKFMLKELKPMVRAAGGASQSCEVLVGHSLGGLFAMQALRWDPAAYSAYAIGDPSVWWNSNEVLKDEPELATRLATAGRSISVFLAHSTVPNSGAGITDAAAMLGRLKATGFSLSTKAYDGDTHNSMLPGFMATALQRGLKCP
jgi:predicted alpha/beta superfamily hydrolase